MIFWFIAAAMTAIVTLAALWPLFRELPATRETRADHDVEVYKAQLRELDADVERGTIAPAESETARAEIGRRLLKAADAATSARGGSETAWKRPAVLAAVAAVALVVPLSSAAFYTRVGAGGLPDEPLAARQAALDAQPAAAAANVSGGETGVATGAPGGEDIKTLVGDAEKRLTENPGDGNGWDVLAPIYLRMDRAADAANAFRKAIALLGPTASREGGLGEALTQVAGGEVTDDAKAAFERSLTINANYLPSHFFLALDRSQEGDNDGAQKAWSKLIDMSPPNAPWLEIANAALADARSKLGGGPGAQAPAVASADGSGGTAAGGSSGASGAGGVPGAVAGAGAAPADPSAPDPRAPDPSAEQVAAASEMNAGDRNAMIEGMVSQLAARLEQSPNDVEGWKRLIRSYGVLGKPDEAQKAYRTAMATFPADSAAGREIAAFGTENGLKTAEEAKTP